LNQQEGKMFITSIREPFRSTSVVRLAILICAGVAILPFPDRANGQREVRVVTTLPTYAAITREIAGDRALVEAIARGDEDPHFVNPRPSFAAKIQRADMFVATGLDLELWVPAVLNRANNARVADGSPGNVVAYAGITLLDVPENVSRSGGDVHVFGNPHIHTDPINGIQIARNISAGLKRIDPEGASAYETNLAAFEQRLMVRLYGQQLIDMLGAETILQLAKSYEFWSFVETQQYQGRPLLEYLGGWMAEAKVFRGKRMVCYHKNWTYFSARFGVECAMYVEPQPGMPPSPGHVRNVIEFIETEGISVLFAANYFSRSQVEQVGSRTGAEAVIVPEHVEGEAGVDDYFSLVDMWITHLAAAF
jgi:ABC-type Zn uptake system ZnuABC Zn-binding protein ZnuA